MDKRPEINNKILIWFREMYGRDQERFARFLGILPERLQVIESGADLPLFSELKKISQKLQVPYIIFYSTEPPKYFKPRDIPMRHLVQRIGTLDPESWHSIMRAMRIRNLFNDLGVGDGNIS